MIDRVDKEILKLLQQNGRLSLKTIEIGRASCRERVY